MLNIELNREDVLDYVVVTDTFASIVIGEVRISLSSVQLRQIVEASMTWDSMKESVVL
jgi:hypothetical protein